MAPKRRLAALKKELDESPAQKPSSKATKSVVTERSSHPASDDAEANGGESRSTKRQKLPVRAKDSDGSSHRSVSIEIPIARKLTVSPARQGRSTVDEVRDSQSEESDGGADEFKTPLEKRHFHFDDEDDGREEFVTPLEAPLKGIFGEKTPRGGPNVDEEEDDEEDSDEDDDDAAPEAVSVQQAAADIKRATAAVSKAAEKQAASLKRKRQERDVVLKKQAEQRKQTKPEAPAQEDAPDSGDNEVEEGAATSAVEGADKPMPSRSNKLPALLPDELLESDSEEDASPQDALVQRSTKQTLAPEERRRGQETQRLRDTRVGSTVYRVVSAKADKRLAPKSGRDSLYLKSQMLSRNRMAKRPGGFLVQR